MEFLASEKQNLISIINVTDVFLLHTRNRPASSIEAEA